VWRGFLALQQPRATRLWQRKQTYDVCVGGGYTLITQQCNFAAPQVEIALVVGLLCVMLSWPWPTVGPIWQLQPAGASCCCAVAYPTAPM
jgi:hypothetical protein